MSKLDYWIGIVADLTCNVYGTMTVSEFEAIAAVVDKRGECPPGVPDALERLGYEIRGDRIVGLSARRLDHYVRTYVGESLSVDDALRSVRPGIERRYLAHLLTALPETGGVLTHYALQ